MKALAIDTAITKITIACRNDDKTVSEVFEIGMKQSETLLPAIIDVMKKNELEVKDLDCLAICQGPGSFTGLRLGYACIKALEMTAEKPLYAYSTLDVYAEPFIHLPFVILSVIDAHKDKFYFKAFENEKCIIPEGDFEIERIISELKTQEKSKNFLICGPDCEKLKTILEENGIENKIYTVPFTNLVTDSLFKFAENDFNNGKPGIADYDGPVYLRASEAEENIKK